MKIIKNIGPIYTHSLKRRYLFEHNTDHEFADYGTSLGFSRSSDMVDYDSQNQGVVPNYTHLFTLLF